MPKNLEQEWRVIPNYRETPILETLVRKNQGKFMPKNLEQEWRVIPNYRETPILETLVRKNRQGKFMPKILEQTWRVIPNCRETPILETPTFVRIVGVSLCPIFRLITNHSNLAPLDFQSSGAIITSNSSSY